MRIAVILILVIGAVCWSAPARTADPDKPHPHQGTIEGYDALPEVDLDDKQLEKLAKGKTVIMSFPQSEASGRGMAVLDIAAPPDTVWSRITSFERYVEWVGPVKVSSVYDQRGDTTFTHMKISGFMYSYEYFVANRLRLEDDLVTWTLDYSRYSDFDDNVGCWFVEEHPDKEAWSRVWFSSDLALRTKLPKFLLKFVKKKGLKDATKWVKRESEKAMGKEESRDQPYGSRPRG